MGRKRPCGNPDCSTSTGICGRLTFGSGELDEHGYFDNGCEMCAREWKKKHPDAAVWPVFEEEKPGLKFYN